MSDPYTLTITGDFIDGLAEATLKAEPEEHPKEYIFQTLFGMSMGAAKELLACKLEGHDHMQEHLGKVEPAFVETMQKLIELYIDHVQRVEKIDPLFTK